jgi:hypothetical protein
MSDEKEVIDEQENTIVDPDATDESNGEAAEEEVVVDPDEITAKLSGWCPEEDWRGKKGQWVDAGEFNRRGELIGTVKRLQTDGKRREQEFNDRLEGQHKLHEASKKALIDDLQSRRKDAISEGDVEKTDSIQSRIDDLNVAAPVVPVNVGNESADSDVLNDWNIKNPWVMEDTPKSAFAHVQFNKALSEGKTNAEATRSVDQQIAVHYPQSNPRRKQATTVENFRSNPGSKNTKKISWNDLTRDEEDSYKAMPNAWNNQEQFLQAVTDERKASKV